MLIAKSMKNLVLSMVMCFVCVQLLSGQDKLIKIPGSDQQIEMVKIEGGTVKIGDQPLVVNDYFIGKYEVTHDQYVIFQDRDYDTDEAKVDGFDADAISRPSPPYEDFSKGLGKEGGYPAVSITQQGAMHFCEWLYKKTGLFFRLPTEAEWQYACEKGQSSSSATDEVAWYFDNAYERFHVVGEKKPNAVGVYDMLGNMAEWTSDQYTEDYPLGIGEDHWVVPTRRHSRTVKGGSYVSDAQECTCTYRERSDPRWQMRDPQIPKSEWWNTDAPFVGFRLVLDGGVSSHDEIMAYYKKAIVN